ncbi:MAG: L,D-transpeptidase family protein [Desulfobacteraceae bacterium]|nr:L,D-transpeptidase family protein [Desulfobacteraceae bacterium]
MVKDILIDMVRSMHRCNVYRPATREGQAKEYEVSAEGLAKTPDRLRKMLKVGRFGPGCLFFLILFGGFHQTVHAQIDMEKVREFLRNRIEQAGILAALSVGEEKVYAVKALPRFYEMRAYHPAWIDKKGQVPQADGLAEALQRADIEGLKTSDYHYGFIRDALLELKTLLKRKEPVNPRLIVDLELMLTDGFSLYGSHLLSGQINPETIDAEWFANRRAADFAVLLQEALEGNRIKETLLGLLPRQPGYGKLKKALAKYRAIEKDGQWPTISSGSTLKKGDAEDERTDALRGRLVASGDLDQKFLKGAAVFDDELEQAVIRFQMRHGLEPDGAVGPLTLSQLNVPVEERVKQMVINMERWRWLPQDLGQRHILVNMADFQLDVFEKDRSVLNMKVIVGKAYRHTPVFSDKMTYIVLNPYWHVPRKIAVQDKLPLIKKDPEYFTKQQMKLLQGWGAETKELNPKNIDWSRVSAGNFPYRLRQEPGPQNALGKMKFMFPNRHNVYIHDTPTRELFRKSVRTMSSGCIRIEKPLALAEYVLMENSQWKGEAISSALETNVEQTIFLHTPIPVHLLYWTAFVDGNGVIHFRTDIYHRDKRLEAALHKKPPLK